MFFIYINVNKSSIISRNFSLLFYTIFASLILKLLYKFFEIFYYYYIKYLLTIYFILKVKLFINVL